jgi:hypothetical protein
VPISQGCGQDDGLDFCIYADTGVSAELFSPMDIFPMTPYYESPLYDFPLECAERSSYPMWEVSGFSYNMADASSSTLRLNLTNLSNGIKLPCSVKINETLLEETAHLEHWASCGGDAVANSTDISGTEILFDRSYQLFGVRQNWTCSSSTPLATR